MLRREDMARGSAPCLLFGGPLAHNERTTLLEIVSYADLRFNDRRPEADK